MFAVEDIQARARRRPFQPFRIVASSGESVDVLHPELILVGQTRVVVGRPSPRRPGVFVDLVEMARMHIAAMEDLPSRGSSAGPAGPAVPGADA
jgi:hypothetical protein